MDLYRGLSKTQIFDGLNDEQRLAVETLDGPLLVLAGAGTGKTTVITRRILNLLRAGVRPEQILAVTFTKKAAREMFERVAELLGRAPRGMVVSTFHALGYRILRRERAESDGLAIIEPGVQLDLVRRALEGVDPDGIVSPMRALTAIAKAKNEGLSPDDVEGIAVDAHGNIAAEAFRRYEDQLRRSGQIDFDDLIGLALRELQDSEQLRATYQDRFRYLLVDEYQDTNRGQYLLMQCLVGPSCNLCVVGDDDQSIYRFRGAEVGNILGFSNDYPDARVVKLETNYRSTGEVLAIANAVIRGGALRHPKRLAARAGVAGRPVRLVEVADEEEEGRFIAQEILGLVRRGAKLGDVAVLHRSRTGLAKCAEHLRLNAIPFQHSASAGPAVALMTLHSAKGLEFPHVFMPEVEEGTLPHLHSIAEGAEALEEERRLLYVGLTRAKEGLVLSSSRIRRSFGRKLSRFLVDVAGENVFVRA